ncbi:Lrp/AsnC family transcriptional regulator [Candidatus Woesearchaeota archaeon]|nr:Lrp/AsnC family transcriptional regulator [Candidatus Woesearchaeota archaeon]
MVKIDVKDRKIISALDMDARMPLTELAKKVGLSRQVVEYRIKRLKEEGVILGAKAVFDSATVNYKWYRVAFRMLNVKKEDKLSFIEYLKNHPFVFWLGEVGGNWDIVVNFICEDNFKFNALFEEIINKWGKLICDYEILIYVNVSDMERSYILHDVANADQDYKNKTEINEEGIRKEFFHEMKLNKDFFLDPLDKEIIKHLSKDADISNIELGQKLNVTGNTIKNRIDEMKKSKLLLGFRLFVNPSILGFSSHMLFLGVNNISIEKEKELISYLKAIPNITFIVKHIGKWRIGMEIETKSELEFHDIFVDIRGRFSDIITGFESFPLFKDHVVNYFPEGCLK